MTDGVKLVFKPDKNKTCFVLKKVKAKNLEKMSVPKIYESKYVTVIGKGAFAKCKGLCCVVLPDSISHIEAGALPDTLEVIYYLGTIVEWKRIDIACDLGSVSVVCSDGEVEFEYNADDYGTGERVQFGGLDYAKNADGKSYAVIGASYKYADKAVIARHVGGLPVTAIAKSAFSENNLLESLTIPEGVTVICDGAFSMRWGLNKIALPKSLKVIGAHAFDGSGIESLVVPRGVRIIGEDAFKGCTSLTEAKLNCAVKTLGASAFRFCDRLRTVELAEGVEEICHDAFDGCEKLYTITLPKTLIKIGQLAFMGCGALKLIRFGGTASEWSAVKKGMRWDLDTREYAVECSDGTLSKSCERISAVKMSDVAPSVIADKAYENRKDLTEFVVPQGVTEIGDLAFSGCSELKNITFPDSLEEIGECAFSNSGLTSVHIPASVVSLDYDVFTDCAELAEITVADGNARYCVVGGCLVDKKEKAIAAGVSNVKIPTDKDIEKIADGAFSSRKLDSIVIPENITEVGDHAFRYCEFIEARLSRGVAMLCDFAFGSCDKLTAVYMDTTVKFIGFGVFEDCYALKDVYYNGTKAEFWDIEKEDNWTGGTKLTVHCSDGDLAFDR